MSRYLTFLERTLGPHRALSVYGATSGALPWLVGAAAALVVGGGIVFAANQGETLEHVAYLRAEVVERAPLNNDAGLGVVLDLRLPDGEMVELVSSEPAIFAGIEETACVEARRATETGEIRHRLRALRHCGL